MVRHAQFAHKAAYNFTNRLQDLASNVNQLGLGAHKEKDYNTQKSIYDCYQL
jgi:hypothetical protein